MYAFKDAEEPSEYVSQDGFATVTYPNGDVYEGEFKDRKKHGKGTYTFAPDEESESENEHKYSGEYILGRRAGLGTMHYPDGSRNRGQWVDNARNGIGSMNYANGDIYSGAWLKGKRHGEGTYLFAESDATLHGDWESGAFVSGHFQHSDGTSYEGYFCQQKPEGEGVFRFSKNLVQEGEFASDMWSASGPVATSADFAKKGRVGVQQLREMRRAQMKDARAKFEELDRNGNGVLTADEIEGLAAWVLDAFNAGSDLTSKAKNKMCKKLLDRCDDNHDGVMDFAEFEKWFFSISKDLVRF